MRTLQLFVLITFFSYSAFAAKLMPGDEVVFIQDGGPAIFEPNKKISLTVTRDGKTILTKDLGSLEIGQMADLAYSSSSIQAALRAGYSLDIGDGGADALIKTRRGIESEEKKGAYSISKERISNLQTAIYNLQNSLEFANADLARCKSRNGSSSTETKKSFDVK